MQRSDGKTERRRGEAALLCAVNRGLSTAESLHESIQPPVSTATDTISANQSHHMNLQLEQSDSNHEAIG